MALNGLTSFSLHASRHSDEEATKTLNEEVARVRRGIAASSGAGAKPDPESAARRHLVTALRSESVADFTMPAVNTAKGDFKLLGTEALPFIGTTTVKFRQTYDKIPVYGSLVTVELDDANDLVSMSSNLGQPLGVSPVASIAPGDALELVKQRSGSGDRIANWVGRLIFYFDAGGERWRLAYLFEDVPCSSEKPSADGAFRDSGRHVAHGQWHMDYLIDAHDRTLIAELPRTPSMAETVYVDAVDSLARPQRIGVILKDTMNVMSDDVLGVRTHDLEFGDIDQSLLPGGFCQNPPNPWDRGAVSAHANASAVARFLREVLGRDGLDNAGEPLVSSVNCVVLRESPDGREWRNAAWVGSQMVYGQRRRDGELVSYAASLDIVAHEMLHGLTDRTARIQYSGESGALNESYSDIFGILISNYDEQNRAAWNWQLGEDLDSSGVPIRDLSAPRRHDQPAHMNDYVALPDTEEGDWGGVHINSGIHNKAAHLIMTTADAAGEPLFSAQEMAWLFYVALSQHLSRRSGFADSARALELAALSIFRRLPGVETERRVDAIRQAFERVGVAAQQ